MSDEIAKYHFKCMIADEAHYLKARDSQRSKKLIPILQDSKRVVLLSGTPVLSRPLEAYNLISILMAEKAPSFKEFTLRYCDPQTTRFGVDYTGATCIPELHYLLTDLMMIRRLKKDVLD